MNATTKSDVPIPPPIPHERTSARLKRISAETTTETITVGELVVSLRRRSFGAVFIILGLFGMMPGVSLIAGLLLLIPAVQVLLSFGTLALPRFLRAYEIRMADYRSVVSRVVPRLEKLEKFVRPRWPFFTRPPAANLFGVLVIALALVMMLPLPFSNIPPALAIVCMALGLFERDGVFILVGLAVSAVALAVGAAALFVVVEALSLFVERYFA